MAPEQRKRYLSIALILAVGALVLDRVIGLYADQRAELVNQRDAQVRALADAQNTLKNEKRLRQFLAGVDEFFKSDSSATEGRMMHLLHDWEQQSGTREASFGRVAGADEHGFLRLTFQVSAIGNLWSVAGLLYRVETAPIPLRVENAEVRPGAQGSDDVQIHLSISTLCRPDAKPLAPRLASSVEVGQ
jgi:hypothetical protein